MKKFALSLIACLVVLGSVQAATSPLIESVLEYEAITNAIGAPDFQVISPSEFIIDIERRTKKIYNTGVIKYIITTRATNFSDDQSSSGPEKAPINFYLVKLNVAPNPGIGPNIITVLSIKNTRRQHSHD